MYVDGEIAETDSFIINVGTGYYIRKVRLLIVNCLNFLHIQHNVLISICIQNAEGAKDYFQRRLNYLTQQIETLQTLGNEKSRIKEGKYHLSVEMFPRMWKFVFNVLIDKFFSISYFRRYASQDSSSISSTTS